MGTESHGSRQLFSTQIFDLCGASCRILILTDSRAAECDIVKVTNGDARLLFLGIVEEQSKLPSAGIEVPHGDTSQNVLT